MSKLNFCTRVSADRSVAEIQSILAKAGVLAVMTDYRDGHIESMTFKIRLKDGRCMAVRLPVNVEGTYKLLLRNSVPKNKRNMDFARRVAWRVAKDWVEAQMAYIAADQVSLDQLFLPHTVNPETGMTLYYEQILHAQTSPYLVQEAGQKQLTG